MESVIVAIFCIALILFGALTISQASLSSTDTIAAAWRQMEKTSGEIARTNISSLGAETQSAGTIVQVTLENAGETKLEDFDKWDVIVQYYDASSNYLIKRLPYYTKAGDSGVWEDNEWKVEGIYLDAGTSDPEVFDPGIFNPDEEMIIQMKVDPAVGTGTTNLAIVATPNGVSASAVFTR